MWLDGVPEQAITARYRRTNWSSYTASLKKRGPLLIWLGRDMTAAPVLQRQFRSHVSAVRHVGAPGEHVHFVQLAGRAVGQSLCFGQALVEAHKADDADVDLPGFCGERLAHFPGLSLEGDWAFEAER